MSSEKLWFRAAEVLEEFLDTHGAAKGLIYAALSLRENGSVETIEPSLDFLSDDDADSVRLAIGDAGGTLDPLVRTIRLDQGNDVFMSTSTIDSEYTAPVDMSVHVLMDRPPTSALPPLILRQLTQTLELAIVDLTRPDDLDDLEFAYLAARARVNPVVMQTLASMCRAEGAILWEYDFADETYASVSTYGPFGDSYRLTLSRASTADGHTRGVVSQARPGIPLVVYSRQDPSRRVPRGIQSWEPHEPSILTSNGWDACVAWPVIADGHLLGAISIYGPAVHGLRFPRTLRNKASLVVSEILRDRDLREELRRSETAFEEELSKNSTGRLAGELVHDYKNALETIENLLKNIDPDRLGVGVRKLYVEGKSSIAYLKDVTRSLSKLTKGKKTAGSTDIAMAIHNSSAFLMALAQNENPRAKLHMNVPKQVAKGYSVNVRMDDLTALRVLGNLVHNAAIWTKGQDHPRIEIELRPANLDKSLRRPGGTPGRVEMVRLTVSDNGPGIRLEDRQKVFNRGWTNRRADGGSGLGLYIVKKSIEDAGGTIHIEGRPGEGATFVGQLPAVEIAS